MEDSNEQNINDNNNSNNNESNIEINVKSEEKPSYMPSFISDPEENKSKDFYGSKSQIELPKEEKTFNSENTSLKEKENLEKMKKDMSYENCLEPIKSYNYNYVDQNEHFFCKKCYKVPIIKFLNINDIIYTCDCTKNHKIKIKDFLNDTIVKIDEDIENTEENDRINKSIYDLAAFYCQEHKKERYCYYCDSCSEHLCRKCLREVYNHNYDLILIFDQLMFDTDKKITFINDKFNLNSSIFENESSEFLNEAHDKIERTSSLIKLMSVIFNDYNHHTNYSHFQIISNCAQYIEFLIKKGSEEQYLLDLKEQITIYSKRDLLKDLNNKSELIININIKKNNLFDISQICQANLINLEELALSQNNISNIEPLINAKFKKVKKIDLSDNKIGDNNIEYFKKLKFKELKELNLFSNNLIDFHFFEIVNNVYLKKLELLYIGSNRFINNSNIDIEFDASNIEEIGLSNGIFNNSSIHLINNFKFTNLKILFLQCNDIYSLSFVDNLELPNIKQFWINSCFISDYFPLIKYKTLEKIMIRNNCIEKIDNLIEFINSLEDLKILDISGNYIDLNNNQNESIINEAKTRLEEFKYY